MMLLIPRSRMPARARLTVSVGPVMTGLGVMTSAMLSMGEVLRRR